MKMLTGFWAEVSSLAAVCTLTISGICRLLGAGFPGILGLISAVTVVSTLFRRGWFDDSTIISLK